VELLLIRHAEPIRIEQVGVPADPPLHERGVHQAARLAEWLAEEAIDGVWSSPMRRALETAAPLSEACATEVIVDDGLAEWDRESSEYIPIEELKAARDERWYALIRGEAFTAAVDPETFRQGIVDAMERVVAANPGRRVAVVCHGGVINMYLSWVLGLPEQHFFLPHYTSISRVAAARSGERSIISINETAHLRPIRSAAGGVASGPAGG
jgi:probable phosphoglycerate mutase